MKELLNKVKEKDSYLSEKSTIRVLYMALLQNDPKFVLDYLYMTSLKNKNQTVAYNFKAMSYAKLNRFDDALNQIDALMNMESNQENNLNGLIFKETVFSFYCRISSKVINRML